MAGTGLNPEKKFLILYFAEMIMSVWTDGFLTWDMLDDRSRIWECHDSKQHVHEKKCKHRYTKQKAFF